MPDKNNIAIIIPGGIGTGLNNIGVPVLERMVKLLSKDFNLTVFQLFKANHNFKVAGFELIDTYSPHPLLKSLKFFFLFWKIHRQRKFQVVHGFWSMPCGFFAVIIGKFFGIKSMVSVLGGDAIALPEIRYGQLQNPLYRKLIMWSLREANEVISLTQYLVDNLKKYDFERKNIKIIPWGIDIRQFYFREKPLSSPVQFLHIANLHPVKDQETLVRAFKIISDKIPAYLTIIGEGISEEKVKSLITELNLSNKVTMHGLLPYEELPAYYHRADVLLHTSLSEGQCEVVTEAMSCGVLVCGTKVGLLYDLPDCCVAVSVQDYKALASETLILIANPSRFNSIMHNAHQWTTEHSIHWTVGKLKESYF